MAYALKYRLSQAPVAQTDGSGMVDHTIQVIYQVDGQGSWLDVPGRARVLHVPATGLKTVMDMPDSTGGQKTAKNSAYKELVANSLEIQSVPMPVRWSADAIKALLTANAAADAEAVRANGYFAVTLGLNYPVDFVI